MSILYTIAKIIFYLVRPSSTLEYTMALLYKLRGMFTSTYRQYSYTHTPKRKEREWNEKNRKRVERERERLKVNKCTREREEW